MNKGLRLKPTLRRFDLRPLPSSFHLPGFAHQDTNGILAWHGWAEVNEFPQVSRADGGLSDLRIKICGITNEADGLQATLLGADALGLNFYAGSPRRVDAATAAAIMRELPPFVDVVGLFVNLPVEQAIATLGPLARIRTLQWYGDAHEPVATSPYQLIAAFSVRGAVDVLILFL